MHRLCTDIGGCTGVYMGHSDVYACVYLDECVVACVCWFAFVHGVCGLAIRTVSSRIQT